MAYRNVGEAFPERPDLERGETKRAATAHQLGGDGRRAGRRLLGARRGDGAAPRTAGPATRGSGSGAATRRCSSPWPTCCPRTCSSTRGGLRIAGPTPASTASTRATASTRPPTGGCSSPPVHPASGRGWPPHSRRTWISPPTRASPTPTRDVRTTTTSPRSSPASSPGASARRVGGRPARAGRRVRGRARVRPGSAAVRRRRHRPGAGLDHRGGAPRPRDDPPPHAVDPVLALGHRGEGEPALRRRHRRGARARSGTTTTASPGCAPPA